MIYIVLGGIIGFAVGNLAGALFAPRQRARPIDALRHRLEQARSDANRAADSVEQSIRDRYENARKD
ncbi:MAG TPA: YtxH domain-containing protein [Chloroflexota bacterium]|nr:YtxH domain-containing protein [Chloroflexota bacterium]